jgi:site-specific recombinase XerD
LSTVSHHSSISASEHDERRRRSAPIPSVTYSLQATTFARNAISDSTRTTYRAAVRQFEEYCITIINQPIHPITTRKAVEWFTHIGTQAKLSSGTLNVYRSALSNAYREVSNGEGANPLDAKMVSMVLEGIQRSWYPREAAAKASIPQSVDITTSLLQDIKPHLPDSEPLHSMVWAAATIGVYALLRPSEILGEEVKADMVDSRRALRFTQITFYEKEGSNQRVRLLDPGSDVDLFAIPDRYTISLGPTKTDQLAKREPKIVAAAPAVQALWRWCHLRRSFGANSPLLFSCNETVPLTMPVLLKAIKNALIKLGYQNPKVTGKCIRRGGASSLVAQGISNEDVARVGDWRTSNMVNIYANREAREARRIATSRLLAPAAAEIARSSALSSMHY